MPDRADSLRLFLIPSYEADAQAVVEVHNTFTALGFTVVQATSDKAFNKREEALAVITLYVLPAAGGQVATIRSVGRGLYECYAASLHKKRHYAIQGSPKHLQISAIQGSTQTPGYNWKAYATFDLDSPILLATVRQSDESAERYFGSRDNQDAQRYYLAVIRNKTWFSPDGCEIDPKLFAEQRAIVERGRREASARIEFDRLTQPKKNQRIRDQDDAIAQALKAWEAGNTPKTHVMDTESFNRAMENMANVRSPIMGLAPIPKRRLLLCSRRRR